MKEQGEEFAASLQVVISCNPSWGGRQAMQNEFYRTLGSLGNEGALYERGYVRRPVPPRFAVPHPPSLPTAPSQGLVHRICLVIERGLAFHRDRLDPDYWREVEGMLWLIDPTMPGLGAFLTQLIVKTRRVAKENGGSYGAWNVTEAMSFQNWALELAEAVDQYRRDCETVGGRH